MIRYPRTPFGRVDAGAIVESPCINVCELDGGGVCMGCFRTADEIAAWPGMGPADRRRLLAVLEDRQAVASGPDGSADNSSGGVRG
jgi:predicted Fe-S protein YdhL (DUF1289 family)